ncbi:MAG: bifunctional adenosylcobinamide kinase/adenosylcobinamide-phosphate guanylyltransferase [Desulfobulbaceae bacterium]|jgi:adenosylcobinamide kinase/adenosylcobinamide-phosphate guanylyltransferase|nr:bifunctional adenosylcobinamide kinase/adenosylcobinamide-phosphate guanylyltransferase [Desulfobulbaceae bacterium]
MASLIILITGGARSGKSGYALKRAEALADVRTFIATSPVTDPEMAERIARHQEERDGRGWRLIEEQTDLPRAIGRAGPGVIVIDCLTLWINNLLYQAEKRGQPFADAEMNGRCDRLIAACRQHDGAVLLVTNEVGMGIVPENALARHYRDLIGRANRRLAAAADEVVFVCCGIPLTIKKDFHETA